MNPLARDKVGLLLRQALELHPGDREAPVLPGDVCGRPNESYRASGCLRRAPAAGETSPQTQPLGKHDRRGHEPPT